jgi:hypothetical protein
MEVDGRVFLDVAMLVGPITVFDSVIAMLLNTNVRGLSLHRPAFHRPGWCRSWRTA